MTNTSTPRPAATVVVVRDGVEAIEVLLVRRNDRVAFMGGAYVFPGGRVDDDDRARTQSLDSAAHHGPRFQDLPWSEELAYRAAGVRELAEEAAVTIAASDLVPIAHWVTPEVETRRYDTRFFLAAMPHGQVAQHDAAETTELAWLTPAAALERSRAGVILLPPPTWTTLSRLRSFASVEDALRWARETKIVRVQPRFVEGGERKMLTLPGDPLFPTIEGWEVPDDTRFVLEEGKGWKPVPA